MRARCVLIPLLLALPLFAQIDCTPTTAKTKQERTKLKHRTLAANAQAKKVTVTQMLGWDPPANFDDPAVRKAAAAHGGTPADPREDQPWQVYKLRGKLWRIVMEKNDCDFHLEIGVTQKGSKGYRVIAEIPNDSGYLNSRKALIQALSDAGKTISPGKDVKLDEAIKIEVLGFAFYDSAHYSKKYPQQGHSHGTVYVNTLWELHPAWGFAVQ